MKNKLVKGIGYILFWMASLLLWTGIFKSVSLADSARTVTVAYYESSNFQEGMYDDVIKTGYSYEYLQKITEYTGWNYEYVYGDWSELYEKFLNGEIDLFPSLPYMMEMRANMEYPDYSMSEEGYFIYIRSDNTFFDDIKSFNRKRVGCIRNNAFVRELQNWAIEKDLWIEYVYYDDVSTMISALKKGSIDCFYSSGYSIPDMNGIKQFIRVNESASYMCVRKGAGDILRELNDALRQLASSAPDFLNELKVKYYRNSSSYISLSAEEKEWLANNKSLRVGCLDNYLPFCDCDSRGKISGTILYIMEEWKKALNISDTCDITYVAYATTAAMVEGLKSGAVDVIFPVVSDPWYGEKEGISLTGYFAQTPMVVIYSGDYSEQTFEKVAITTRPVQYIYCSHYYPDSELINCNSANDCVQAILDNEATCSIITGFRVGPLLDNPDYTEIKSLTLGEGMPYCMGVEKGNTALLHLLNRGIEALDKSAISNNLYSNIQYSSEYGFGDFLRENWLLSILVVFIALFIVIVLFVLYFYWVKKARIETRFQMVISEALSADHPYAVLIDPRNDASITVKRNGKILPARERTRRNEYDKLWRDFANAHIVQEDREDVLRSVRFPAVLEAIKAGREHICTYKMEWNGAIHSVQTIFSKIEGKSKDDFCIIAGFRIIDDIVEQERANNERLQAALVEAKKANQAKTVFLNNMSHDIRTPMNAIMGFASLAVKHIDSKEKVSDYLNKINISGNHLLMLINDVLDMSRIESGKLNLKERDISVKELMTDLEAIAQNGIEQKNIKLSFDCSKVIHEYVYTDKLRINQILLNILGNAVKFTGEGGFISVNLSEVSPVTDNRATYEFRIKDTGIGMSKDFLSHIFEPFSREKNTTVSGIQGTGLGMAITKSVVDLLEGTIEVMSEEGLGTEFIVRLPLKLSDTYDNNKKDETEILEDISSLDISLEGYKILLVEDNALNRDIANDILTDLGMTVDMAFDGEEAVMKAQNCEPGQYDLILMDIQMPKLDGYEATRRIRALQREDMAGIPIVAMTANAFEEDKKMALEAGMNSHISKPIDMDKVYRTIASILTAG